MDSALPATHPACPTPVTAPAERFDTVDLIRGVAVCGILVMNIVSFAMPAAAYLNPEAYLGERTSSHVVYALTHVFADQKFMGLFSLLFGSSVMLFLHKLNRRGAGLKRFYYSRTAWLLVFGLLHGFFLWEGDILFYYALCGFFLYPFWRLPPGIQFTLGLAVFSSAILIDQAGQARIETLPPFALEALEPIWSPTRTDIALEINWRVMSYGEQLAYRRQLPHFDHDGATAVVGNAYLLQGLARAFGLMLVGMALYTWGVVTAGRSLAFYRRIAIGGLALGLPLAGFGLWLNYLHNWDISYGLFAGLRLNHLATPLLVFAYISIVVIADMQRRLPRLRHGLCAIGRMAFTNYIAQSVLCTFIFYGYGLGWFGRLDRLELLVVVAAIWTFQFYFSLLWLHYFQYGPLEWMWRGLTYFRLPRLRITDHDPTRP